MGCCQQLVVFLRAHPHDFDVVLTYESAATSTKDSMHLFTVRFARKVLPRLLAGL